MALAINCGPFAIVPYFIYVNEILFHLYSLMKEEVLLIQNLTSFDKLTYIILCKL